MTQTNSSSEFFNKIDQIMDTLYSGGVNNPMDSIEQISYLIFLRLLYEREESYKLLESNYETIFKGNFENSSWGKIVNLTGDELYITLRDTIENFSDLPGLSNTGSLLFRQSAIKIQDRPTLYSVVQQVNELHLEAQGLNDPKGDIYEYLLSKLETSGKNGQFRTPRHIIEAIVCLIDPKPMEKIME